MSKPTDTELARLRRAIDESMIGRQILKVARTTDQFGDIRLCGVIGDGGFGVVYLAERGDDGSTVALKMPRPRVLADPGLRRRFLTESRALAALNHSYVLPVLEAGEVNGVPFFTMPYCDGGTLAKAMAENKPLPAEAARLIAKLAVGVAHAHGKGVLHRDLKPGNVLFITDPTASDWPPGFSPRIADFGLARILEDNSETQTGVAVGTLHYLSPEQASGRRGSTGPANDIYALGAMLRELLTGRPPLGEYAAPEALGRLLDAGSDLEPIGRWHGVPPALEAIARKCLERDPSSRYGSAADLAADLEHAIAGQPVTARLPGWGKRIRQSAKRNRRAFLTVTGLVAAVPIGWMLLPERFRPRIDPLAGATGYAAELGRAVFLLERGEAKLAGQVLDTIRRDATMNRWSGPEHAFVEAYYRRNSCVPRRLVGHLKLVRDLSFSREGHRLVSCADDGKIWFWDTKTGTRTEGPAVGPQPKRARLSANGTFLATLSHDPAEVRWWNLETGAVAHRWSRNFAHHLALSPDDSLIAATDGSPVTHILSTVSGQIVATVPLSSRITFAHDGQFLLGHATTENDSSALGIYTMATKKPDRWPGQSQRQLRTYALAPDDRSAVVTFSNEHDARINRADGVNRWKGSARGHNTGGPEFDEAFSPDSRFLYFGGQTFDVVRAWWGASGRYAWHSEPTIEHSHIAVSPDGRWLAASEIKGDILLWDTADILPQTVSARHLTSMVWAAAFSPDSKTLYSVGEGLFLYRWTVGTKSLQPAGKALALDGTTTCIAVSPDGSKLVTGGFSGNTQLWDAVKLTIIATWPGSAPVRAVAFSRDGTTIYATDKQGYLSALTIGHSEPRYRVKVHKGACKCLAVSPDGDVIYTSSGDNEPGRACAWGASNGESISEMTVGEEPAAMALSPDGRWLAIAGDDFDRIQIWDVQANRVAAAWSAGGGHVFEMSFGLGAATLTAAMNDGSVRVFDVLQQQDIVTLEHATSPARCVRHSPDRRSLVAGFADGTVLVWIADATTNAPAR